jgi:RHS repeat-associated protein
VEGTIVPSMPGYSFTPGNRPCDRNHRTRQDFTAMPGSQGSVKAGARLENESGQSGVGDPSARHPEAPSSGLHAQDPAGQPPASSYGVTPHGGPGPSPFGREDACGDGGGGLTGNGGADTNAMDSPRAETAATLTNTATYFYVWDQVGSIRLVTDGTGAVVVEHDYEPYGVEILPNAPTSMPTDALAGTHLYTGQERDGDTGLDNFHFRSYASTMGRFLSPDNLPGTPLNPQSFNLYAYVHGNPVNYNDPTGHYAGGLPPGRQYDNGDPFGGLNIPASGGDPGNSVVDALLNSIERANNMIQSLIEHNGAAGNVQLTASFLNRLQTDKAFRSGFTAWLATGIGQAQWSFMTHNQGTTTTFDVGSVAKAGEAAISETTPNLVYGLGVDKDALALRVPAVTIAIDADYNESHNAPSDQVGFFAKAFGREAIYAIAESGGRSWEGFERLHDIFEAQNVPFWCDSVPPEARYHKELEGVADVMGFSVPY